MDGAAVAPTFDDAMRHVDWTCNGRKSDRKTIVRKLAEAKGLVQKARHLKSSNFLRAEIAPDSQPPALAIARVAKPSSSNL
jgi:hypothetical protein